MLSTLDSTLELISPIGRDTTSLRTTPVKKYDPPFDDPEVLNNWGRIAGNIIYDSVGISIMPSNYD